MRDEATQDRISPNGQQEPAPTLTVGEAVDAYRDLQCLDPRAIGKDLTNEVLDAQDQLEPVVDSFQSKARAHFKRCAEENDDGDLELVDEDEFENTIEELREQDAEVHVEIDIFLAPSTGVVRAIQGREALDPVLP